jgi:hypothetical protein
VAQAYQLDGEASGSFKTPVKSGLLSGPNTANKPKLPIGSIKMSGGGTGGSQTRMTKPGGGLGSMKPKMIVKKKFQMAAPDETE